MYKYKELTFRRPKLSELDRALREVQKGNILQGFHMLLSELAEQKDKYQVLAKEKPGTITKIGNLIFEGEGFSEEDENPKDE
jgi:hypothetical protein